MGLIKDIETSTLEELNLWAKSLDLPTGKNESSVRKSLAQFYKIELSKENNTTKGKIITINRAELSTYYTLEEVDESIAEFEGRVEIVIDDTEQKIQHSIIADKINFNRTLNSVTALGNVEYIKTEQGKPELITADSLTFNLTNWKGSLLKCISKQKKVINEEDMVFYYVTGEIKKSDTEVMGMNNVTIQTVPGSPYFNISAMDLWMLDSSDFVIVLPSVKVGHVPVFIFPFYYHSENNLYFNPVYGVKTREGTTLQNTLYLIGSKPINKDESDFSFLSFDNGEGSSNKELNGLTLVPSDNKTKYSSDYSKLMIDYYSNLGLFIGNDTELNFTKLKTKINIEAGLGFSRNIDDDNGQIFTNNKSNWNSSYLFENEVPFRYMLYVTLTSPIANLNFTTMSDSYFRSDFLNREENFKWVDYFTDQLDDGVESITNDTGVDSYKRDTTGEGVVDKYSYGIDFIKFSPKVKTLNPFIDSFILDFKKIEIDFNSKISKNVTTDEENNENIDINYEDFDPSYKFFYPEEVQLPLSITLSGKFFDSSFKKSVEETSDKKVDVYKYENPIFDILNPTIEEDDSEVAKDEEAKDLKIYEISDSSVFKDERVATTKSSEFLTTSFKYNIKVPINIYGYWDSDTWYNKFDIDYDLSKESVLYNLDPSVSGVYSLDLLSSFLKIVDTVKGNLYLKSYIEEDEQDNLLSMYKWNKTLLENNLSITLDMLKIFPDIKNHSVKLKYYLNTQLYKKSFDLENYTLQGSDNPIYKVEEFEWTEDYVNKNEISAEYNYDIGFSSSTIEYIRVLPPFDEEQSIKLKQEFDFDILDLLKNKSKTTTEYNTVTDIDTDETIETISLTELYSIDFKGLTGSAGGGFDYSESFIDATEDLDEWDFDSLKFKLGYKFKDKTSLSFTSEYSIEDEDWEAYSGTLSLWDLDITLVSSFKSPVNWIRETSGWDIDTLSDKELKADSLTIKHNANIKEFTFWKNRITLDIKSDLTFKKEFIKVDKSYLKYNLNFNFDVYDFLTFKFISSSSNNSMFQYWSSDRDTLGIDNEKEIFTDLIKSFNFFSDDDRSDSSFNLNSISIESIYKMPDWNLLFKYTGKPELQVALPVSKVKWYQVFSLFIEWKPLSLVRSKVTNDDEDWSVSTSAKAE